MAGAPIDRREGRAKGTGAPGALLALLSLAIAAPVAAQDLEWAMQERARGQIGARALGLWSLGELEVAGETETRRLPLGLGVGGELSIGGALAGWLSLEVRVGYARMALEGQSELKKRDLWFGLAGSARLVPESRVTPVLGVGVTWHEMSHDVDGIALHLEPGVGLRASRDVWLTLGAAAVIFFAEAAPELRVEPFLALHVLL